MEIQSLDFWALGLALGAWRLGLGACAWGLAFAPVSFSLFAMFYVQSFSLRSFTHLNARIQQPQQLTDSSLNMDDDSSGDRFLSEVLGNDANEDSDDDGGGKPAAYAETTTLVALENIKSIWDDDMVLVDKAKKRWTCLWCKNLFSINATKAVAHLSKTKSELQKCRGKIDDLHFKRYKAMQKTSDDKRAFKKRSSETMDVTIGQHNDVVANKLDQRKEARRSGTIQNSNGGSTSASDITPSTSSFYQSSIENSFSSNPSNDSKLTMAVADLIQSHGLPFSLASSPKFHNVLALAKTCSTKFQLPSRRRIAGELLDVNYEAYREKNMKLITLDCDVYGVAFFGDGATIKKVPLINCLVSGAHLPAACLEIVNCAAHLVEGGKKDAKYIAQRFHPYIEKLEADHPGCVDLVLFDGASNVQKAGEILCTAFARMTVIHSAKHVLSLFNDLFKIKQLKCFITISRLAYKFFGSGTMHKPYATFQAYAKEHNNNVRIGLIRAADTRMAGHVISLLRMLRLKNALQSTVLSNMFIRLKVRCELQYGPSHDCTFLMQSTVLYRYFTRNRMDKNFGKLLKTKKCGSICV